MEPHPSTAEIGRRRLLTGAGAVALMGAGGLGGRPAEANPRDPAENPVDHPVDGDQPQQPTDPGSAALAGPTIASAPVSGYVYRFLDFYDFTTENWESRRVRENLGVRVDGISSPLWGSMEIPPGARVAEVEWYYYNPSATTTTGRARLWTAGSGALDTTVVDVVLTTNSGLGAKRAFVSLADGGPFPHGSKLALGFDSSGKSTLNGVRVGFSGGGGVTGLLSVPIRAYDSRVAGGKFAAGETRTLTMPTPPVTPGTTGVVINLTAVGGSASGYLRVYPANGVAPAVSSINFSGSGAAIANALLVGVNSAGQLKVYASQPVHVVIDVSGTVG